MWDCDVTDEISAEFELAHHYQDDAMGEAMERYRHRAMGADRERARNSYSDRRAACVCVGCGGVREAGRVRCRPCLDKVLAAVRKHTKKIISAGLCYRCGRRNPAAGVGECNLCRVRYGKRYRIVRKSLKNERG